MIEPNFAFVSKGSNFGVEKFGVGDKQMMDRYVQTSLYPVFRRAVFMGEYTIKCPPIYRSFNKTAGHGNSTVSLSANVLKALQRFEDGKSGALAPVYAFQACFGCASCRPCSDITYIHPVHTHALSCQDILILQDVDDETQ
ncbi:hypothetical protein APHAL10511_005302 [Amanita phalloides]|nr:hypothetical protein APHAL10511_005302 [Amanita phalloides]